MIKRRIAIKDIATAEKVIDSLLDRVEELEKIVKVVYHKQNVTNRANASAMHDTNTSLSNANRKISQFSKV